MGPWVNLLRMDDIVTPECVTKILIRKRKSRSKRRLLSKRAKSWNESDIAEAAYELGRAFEFHYGIE